MKLDFLFERKLWMPGWGEIALSAFIIALVSGVLLVPFIPSGNDSFVLISKLIASQAGYLLHSVHSYSADIFLISLAMHTVEYLYKKVHLSYSMKSWFWLVLLSIVSILVVLSGFLSMGSKESISAIAILKGVFDPILLIGKPIIQFLFGRQQVSTIYTHHVSSFTVLSLILIYIHIRRLKPEFYSLIYTMVLVLVLSWLQPAAIGHLPDSVTEVVKGPWYFIGLQEMLGWMQVWLAGILFPLVGIGLFSMLPFSERSSKIVIKFLLLILLFYVLEMLVGVYLRGDEWQLLLR